MDIKLLPNLLAKFVQPERKVTSANIAWELLLLFNQVAIPKDILTDQGTPFHLLTYVGPVSPVAGTPPPHLSVSPPNSWAGRVFQGDTEANAPPSG